ncbi:MAG TPA: heavy metal sensor histidine kinase [Bryobacteraceae bacterium]|nr:heavy metal sensor histidine kinase [Bryobacteraceae bacterium]
MIKSLRLRLTAWYLGFFSLLFLLFGVLLYGAVSRALEQRLDELLTTEATTASSLMQEELEEMHGDAAGAAADVLSEMQPRASVMAFLEGTELVAASTAGPKAALVAAARRGWSGSPAMAFHLPDWGKNGARAVAHRLSYRGRSFTVLALEPLDSLVSDLEVLRETLAVAFPLLLVLAGAGGYLLTRRGLAPVGWMAEQAKQITDQNLEARLNIGNAAEELTLLAASFNELLSRLDHSFEGIRRFVQDASHEMRTPLAVIRGEADVALSQDRSAAEYQRSLTIIQDESRRLSRLVEDLLNLARADAGRVQLQLQEIYLNDLLAECCRSVQSLALARQIEIQCHCAEDVAFRGDEELLRRMVVNLLDNAIRYTPPGGTVSASLEAQGADVRIRVADTGEGIDAEDSRHVFERFYRADKARSRQQGGFGLGLSIVKWIAECHHGGVELSSQPGRGSTFTVRLQRQ